MREAVRGCNGMVSYFEIGCWRGPFTAININYTVYNEIRSYTLYLFVVFSINGSVAVVYTRVIEDTVSVSLKVILQCNKR